MTQILRDQGWPRLRPVPRTRLGAAPDPAEPLTPFTATGRWASARSVTRLWREPVVKVAKTLLTAAGRWSRH